MKLSNIVERLYHRLLSMYPPAFRVAFGDEMGDVFAQALEETRQHGVLPVILFALHELFDLSREALVERLREQRQLALYSGGLVMSSTAHIFRLRLCTVTLTVGFVAYLALVVLPFFAYGMHLQPAGLVAGGSFDPKDFPLYTVPLLGTPLRMATLLMMPLLWVIVIAFDIVLLITLPLGWRGFTRLQKALGILVLFTSVTLAMFVFSPLGRLIMAWQVD